MHREAYVASLTPRSGLKVEMPLISPMVPPRSYISRIEKKALEKLRNVLEKELTD